MICLIALAVFGILGIFSATHRAYAKEAFDCVFRKMTLRKCNTSFDQKMKMKITTGIMKMNPKIGGFAFKYFEIISWALTILMIVSLIYSAIAVYNIAVHGTCDPQNPDSCVLTPQQAQAGQTCSCGKDAESCSSPAIGGK